MSGPVERALRCLGKGFDVTCDFRDKYCKGSERLLVINEDEKQELAVPGFGSVSNVSVDIKCDKGDRMRYQSDVLEFSRMSELFNQRSSLAGKIPSGHFNSMFGFNGSSWARDASETRYLAMDGYFISLFNLHIDRRPLVLSDHVINAVPSTWDPAALARFIENYGTHIIVGLGMGGQDVVYLRQDQSSSLSPSEIKHHLDKLCDQIFTGTCSLPPHWTSKPKSKDHKLKVPDAFNIFDPQSLILDGFGTVSCKEGITVISSKRGGDAMASSHYEWLLTVPSMPGVINFTFVPITSLLKGVPGTGFLTHAVNLYLRSIIPENFSANLKSIPVLNGTNFKAWKENLLIILGVMDLDLALRTQSPPPLTKESTSVSQREMEEWKRSNRMCLMLMKNAIPENLRGAISDEITTAKGFLSDVENRFVKNERGEIGTLLTILNSVRYKGTGNIREHILKMSNVASRLKALEPDLYEALLVHFILISLPSQFNQFKMSYNLKDETWSLDELISHCVQEKNRLEQGRQKVLI